MGLFSRITDLKKPRLYSRIIDLQKLRMAWKKVYKNKPAAGTDNVGCEQFQDNVDVELKQLYQELQNHSYKALPVKLVTIYHGEKAREIALYSMRDKVVQQSVAAELGKLFHLYGSKHHSHSILT